MKKNNMLLIVDVFFNKQSGSLAANEKAKLLRENGYVINVYSNDGSNQMFDDGGKSFLRRFKKNTYSHDFDFSRDEYNAVLDECKPDIIFLVAGVFPYAGVFIEEAKKRNIKVVSMCYTQDFFCARSYSNDLNSPCFECINNLSFSSFIPRWKKKCNINTTVDYAKDIYRWNILKKIQQALSQVDYIIGSTNEQLEFYKKIGMADDKCIKIPLTFNKSKLENLIPCRGDYFLCIAQDRTEKGYQFIPSLLDEMKSSGLSTKIKIAYYSDQEAEQAISKYALGEYISAGLLEVTGSYSWGNGLGELIAGSLGIIQPTIWPTTTEFALLEAIGLKKPVFTFNVGIHGERIINEKNGFIAEVGDCKTMVSQMMQLSKDPHLYERVSEGAFTLYKDLTDESYWHNAIKKYFIR
ncbi:glycosyltransferase [Flavobacterium sp. TSSA_36]|uniref:glycosyltransferase n=1 Tax=Flavobacterium sp. TSSA_36 TaxID=3447669 RepID=UPI003F2DE09D